MTRLNERTIIWLATTRPDSRPHLTPIWYVWRGGRVCVCTNGSPVKAARCAASCQGGRAVYVTVTEATVGEHDDRAVDQFAVLFRQLREAGVDVTRGAACTPGHNSGDVASIIVALGAADVFASVILVMC